MIMPFGKHEGEEVSDLPIKYLHWLKSVDLFGPLKIAVYKELGLDPEETPEETPRRYIKKKTYSCKPSPRAAEYAGMTASYFNERWA